MIDFSQYSFVESKKEETFSFSDKKAKIVLMLAFGLLLLVTIELSVFLIARFPKGGYWFFLIINMLAFIFCVVMIFISASMHKRAKQTNSRTSYTHASKPVYLLTALMYASIAFVFFGRIINPVFLGVL